MTLNDTLYRMATENLFQADLRPVSRLPEAGEGAAAATRLKGQGPAARAEPATRFAACRGA